MSTNWEPDVAEVVYALARKMARHFDRTGEGSKFPTVAQYRAAIAPYLQRKELIARIDEAAMSAAAALRYPRTERQKELAVQLYECEMEIAKRARP